MRGGRASFDKAMEELKSRDIVDIWVDEDAQTVEYAFRDLWDVGGRWRYNFWRSAAEFLYAGHGVEIQDWVRGLDFSIFDRIPPAGRDVPWR